MICKAAFTLILLLALAPPVLAARYSTVLLIECVSVEDGSFEGGRRLQVESDVSCSEAKDEALKRATSENVCQLPRNSEKPNRRASGRREWLPTNTCP
jgi:hypothetical protein